MYKYKPGDRVKIKTWQQMRKEYGLNDGNITCLQTFTLEMEENINKFFPDRILTIEEVNHYYIMKECGCYWTDDMIECLAEDYGKLDPILNRFEILDL